MKTHRRERLASLPRALRWPLYALLALYLGYLLLGNLFLNTPLGPWALNRRPAQFSMHWGPGATWWPGRVALWNVQLRGQTPRQRWQVDADRVHGRLRLLPLLRRQVDVPELHANGLDGAIERAVPAGDAQAGAAPLATAGPSVAATSPAPAAGLAAAAHASPSAASPPAGAPAPAAGPTRATAAAAAGDTPPAVDSAATAAGAGPSAGPDAARGAASSPPGVPASRAAAMPAVAATPVRDARPAWTLQFGRIVAEQVRGFRFDRLRLAGEGRAEVGFFKQLRGGPLEVYPSRLDFSGATLRWNDEELLRGGRVHGRFELPRHSPAQARGLDVLALARAALQLQGDTAALALQRDAGGRPHFRNAPGQGRADLDLRWTRGELASGSRLQWDAPVLEGAAAGGRPLGVLALQLRVDQDLHLRARMPESAGEGVTLDADLRLRGRQLPLHSLRSLLPRASGHVRAQWRFASLDWIPALFPQAGWLALDGEGQVDADLRVADGALAAGSRLQVPQVKASAAVMGNHIEGQAQADLRVDADAHGHLLPTLALRMQRFVIAADDARGRPFVDGRDLRLDLRTRADARGVAGLRDTTTAHLVFHDARVPDLRAYNRYLPQAQMRFEGGSGRLSGDLQVEPGGQVGRGWLRVDATAARLHLAGLALRGDVAADVRLQRADLKGETFRLDASTLDLRNVSFSGPDGRQRGGWWARIVLEDARMGWRQPIAVDSRARISVRDIGFLLALYTRDRNVPAFLYRIVDAGQAQLTGRVQWHGDTLVLDRLRAGNARFDVRARLRLQGQRRSGSLFAQWGLLSAAVALRDDTPQWHLLRARDWYEAQPDLAR